MQVSPNLAYRTRKELPQKTALPDISFHDLQHTFTTTARKNGMDIKTLLAMIGHIPAETNLNIYTHITDDMQRNAADKIERFFERNEGGLGETEQAPSKNIPAKPEKQPQGTKFKPYKGKLPQAGTGGASASQTLTYSKAAILPQTPTASTARKVSTLRHRENGRNGRPRRSRR